MFVRILLASLALALAPLSHHAPAQADGPDYERAASFGSAKLMSMVKNLYPSAQWIGDEDRFWIRDQTADGMRYLVVKAATGKQTEAFDHTALAASLAANGVENVTAQSLPIASLDWSDTELLVLTSAGRFRCSLDATSCTKDESPQPSEAERPSPDGSKIAFIRDYNVWVRDVASGQETAFTRNGEEGFSYGDLGFGLTQVQRRRAALPHQLALLNWSPDGRYLAAMRIDFRQVPVRSYVEEHLPPDNTFSVTHPTRVVVAADHVALEREISVIDTQNGKQVKAAISPSKLHDYAPYHFASDYLWWNLPGQELFFGTAENGGQTYGIASMNITTGDTRMVVEESEEHYYAFNARDYNAPNFYVTENGGEAIFYSQRSGAGHLYLYDARAGALKNPLTSGPGVVFDLIRVDEKARQIYFTAGGREPGRDPYYAHLYRTSFNGGSAQLLTPEDAAHEFSKSQRNGTGSQSQFSPSGKYFVDVYSTLEQSPEMVIRKANGKLVSKVISADISALEAFGWSPPERFVVKAADGVTDLYGAMFKPIDFDPALKYAVVDQTYPGPQTDSGPHKFMDNFAAITTRDAQATAEAGLIVVGLDGRGTTRRDRKFRYTFAGTKDIFGAADHKAAIENLARQHPYVDATRVGITGGSYGGYGSMRAALLFPDFFKVVVSHVGPHEYLHSVPSGVSVERFFGVAGSERDHYDEADNIAIIDNLQADLMLVYGEIDENVPFRAAMAIYDALIKADKDFTTYVVPNANHAGAALHPYIVKRQLKYFREHLGGPQAR